MLSSLAPARRRLVLGLGTLVVLVALVVALAVALRPGAAPGATRPDGVAQDRPGPVLLVPGYGGSVASLEQLARALHARGKDVTIVTLPGGAVGDLNVQAQALGAAARQALTRAGSGSVDVVGYSAGGVVGRLWVTDDGGRSVVRRLVTLGSPHHGTQLAALGALVEGGCPVACQQLAIGSDLLTRLDAARLPPGPAYLSIWTTQDDVVLPPDSARLDGARNVTVQSVCAASRVRHSGLPDDPTVEAMVAQALGAGPIPTWTAADCARLSS